MQIDGRIFETLMSQQELEEALEAEVQKHTKIAGTDILIVKQVVIQLTETEYVDSSGLGALIRLSGVLRAAGGGLKLCQLSPT